MDSLPCPLNWYHKPMSMQQYLARYAESDASDVQHYLQHAKTDFDRSWEHVLCIPAFAEAADFLEKLTVNIQQQSALIILVVNASAKADPGKIEQTRQIAAHLCRHYSCAARIAPHIQLLSMSDKLDVLLVEHISPGLLLAEKEGVGLARKIACDIACQCIALGVVKTPWIHSSDADVVLPHDYFQATANLDSRAISAGIYPFQHTPHNENDIVHAQQCYDLAMDYYVAGLKWAGSPWAFHTIGSTLLINSQHYAKARGFPRRQAGEDFYLLNKLAKIGEVINLQCAPLALESRLSDRVPFGTGPALLKIMTLDDPQQQYLYYHPDCFLALKCWLHICQTLQPETSGSLSLETITTAKTSVEAFSTIFSKVDSKLLLQCLKALGVDKAMAHAGSHSKTKHTYARHMHNWFDAFLTLKFIHWMRDNALPSLPLHEIRGLESTAAIQKQSGLELYPSA